MHKKLVKIGRVVPEIGSRTDRQTRSSQYSAPLSGRSNKWCRAKLPSHVLRCLPLDHTSRPPLKHTTVTRRLYLASFIRSVVSRPHRNHRAIGGFKGGQGGRGVSRTRHPTSSMRDHLAPVDCKKTFQRSGLRSGPRWGSTERSPRSWWGAADCPLPTCALGPLCLAPNRK